MALPNKMTSKYFRKYAFQPNVVIDVGVHEGTPFLYKSFPDKKFLLVDPLEESKSAIEQKWTKRIDYDFVVCGVGGKKSTAELHIPVAGKARTSLHDRKALGDEEVETRQVAIKRLDEVTRNYDGPFGLKIDVEGNELEVLKGARETLKRCEFVIIETSIKRRFDNGYKFSDVIAIMAKNGFEVHSFLSGLTRSPRMSDVLFIKWEDARNDIAKS